MVRLVEMGELDACAGVVRQSFATVAKEFGLTKQNCPTNGAFLESERLVKEWREGNILFALFQGEKMLGFAGLKNKGNGVFELEKLAVLPPYRHCGHGRALLGFAKKQAIGLGGKRLTIGIIEENERLKSWYARQGFRHTGTRVFAHLPFTVGFMELNL